MMRRRPYKFMVFCCIIFLIVGFGIGYYSYAWINIKNDKNNLMTQENQSIIPDELQLAESNNITVAADESGENIKQIINEEKKETILSDTKIIFKTNYLKCHHNDIKEGHASEDMINLTRDELKNNYQDWEIETFSSEVVVLSRNIKDKCLEHYIVKEYNGRIAIYYQSSAAKEPIKDIIDINIQQLREEDIEKLKTGISVDSNKDLAQIIEDFTS